MTKNPLRNPVYLAAASLLVVAVIDLFTPTVFVVDILYLSSIVIVFKQDTRTILAFCIAACLLIVLNVLLFDLKQMLSLSLWVNRGISIFAICITSYIAIHYRKVTQAGRLKEQAYLKALKEMLFITSHKVRKPVASILGLIDVINLDNADLSPVGIKEYCGYLNISAIELDSFVRELNAFIAQTEIQNKPEND